MKAPISYIRSITMLSFVSAWVFISCSQTEPIAEPIQQSIDTAALRPDVSRIPKDTISCGNPNLALVKNLYLLKGRPFSGIIKAKYSNGKPRYYLPVYNGMQHGWYKSFYASGQPFEIRQYKNNLSNGRHYGYWDNGVLRFDYIYVADRREGYNKQWYRNGSPYIFAQYKNDHEEGLQQAWRPNGKLFLNYVAKDGHTYGLQETMLCYTLRDQKIRKL